LLERLSNTAFKRFSVSSRQILYLIDFSKHSINFLKRSRKHSTNTYETSYFRQGSSHIEIFALAEAARIGSDARRGTNFTHAQ